MSIYQEIPSPIIIQGGGSGGGGSGTVSAVGTFSTISIVNGGTVTSSSVIFGPADATNPGMVSTSAQTFAGLKTFTALTSHTTPNIVLGTNGNLAITDSSSAFITRTSAVDCTGFGGGGTLNKITSGNFNTSFGWGNLTGLVTGGSNVVVGAGALNALTGGTQNVGIGVSVMGALTNGSDNVSIGNGGSGGNLNTGTLNVFIGTAASPGPSGVSSGSNNVALGANTLGLGGIGNFNIALGAGANIISTTASNLLVIGGSSGGGGVSQGYIGNGITNASPRNFSFNATGGSGSNIAGATLTIAGGRGTGAGIAGQVVVQVAPNASSGSTLNTLVTASNWDTQGNFVMAKGLAMSVQRIGNAASGGSTTINDNTSVLLLHGTGTLVTYTITFPANPIDGQCVNMSSDQAITTLTLSGNAGQTVVGTFSTLALGSSLQFIWSNTDAEWFPI